MNKLRVLIIAALCLGQAVLLYAQKTEADVRVITDANRESMAGAMPSKLLTSVKQPRRILVLSRSMGYYHKATPLGKLFCEMVQKTFNGYTFVMTDDPEAYCPENLKQYDALIFNNNTGIHNLIKDPVSRQGIIQFVQDGGGIMCIHAASDGGWPAYNEMIGSRFAGHPWTGGGTHAFLNEDPAHRMTAQFGAAFKFKDEIYISRDYFERERFRVLVSMDMSDKETASKPAGKTRRDDRDYSVSHIRAFGKGRVFYTSFGHTDIAYFDRNVLTHYLAGIQYVAGDLAVDDKPIAFYERLKTHEGARYYEAKQKLVNMIKVADTPEKRQKVAALCTKLVQDSSATAAIRQLAVESLSHFATAESLQVVAGAVVDESVQHAALLFLSEHADDAAFKKIINARWSRFDDDGKVAVINALGTRGSLFVGKLLALSKQGALPIRTAAIKALGRCGATVEATALLKLREPELAAVRDAAVIEIARRLAAADSGVLYTHLLLKSDVLPVRQAALVGLARTNPLKAEALVLRYMSGADAALKQTAIMASAYVQGSAMTAKLAERVVQESPANAVMLMRALAGRGDLAAINLLETYLDVPVLRIDAIKLLATVGGARHVPALAEIAAGGDAEAKRAAADALVRLRGDGVEQAIADRILNATPEIRLALLNICDERRTPVLTHAAATFIAAENPKIAGAALKAVALTGSKREFDTLCAVAAANPKDRKIAAALGKLGERLHDDEAVAAALIHHAQQATLEGRGLFVKLLSRFPVPATEAYFLSLLEGQPPETELEAVKGLAAGGSAAALQALLGMCEKGQTAAIRDVAFKAAAEAATKDRQVAPKAKVQTLASLLECAATDSQLVAVLSALSNVPDDGVEALAKSYYNHAGEGVSGAAKAAVSGSAELMSKVDWGFSSNFNNNPGAHKRMVDMKPETRWTSRAYMHKSDAMWISVDLGYEQAVVSVLLDTTGSGGDFPRKYELYVSSDSDDFGEPVAAGSGAKVTRIACNARGRYVKIVQTGQEGPFWSIHELKINGLPRHK